MDALADLQTPDDFESLLAREEVRRGRTGELLTVAMVDLDGMREINRELGAGTGTDALRLCAATLRSTLRAVDEVARTGPDEFAVLMHATGARDASIWADRFEDELAAISFEHAAGPLTCSIGIADTSSETLLDAAAKAHRRMEVIQTMRKLRRSREGGAESPGPA